MCIKTKGWTFSLLTEPIDKKNQQEKLYNKMWTQCKIKHLKVISLE